MRPGTEFEDRATVLIAGALLDQALEAAILTHFVNLNKNEKRDIFSGEVNGPLSSFAHKIRISYALGIIGKNAKEDLNVIKAIRNAFAHAFDHVDFSTETIKLACEHIKVIDRLEGDVFNSASSGPEERFRVSVFIYLVYLYAEENADPIRYSNPKYIDVLS